VYGMVLASELNKPEKGMAYGQLSLALVERFQNRPMKARVMHINNAMLWHWKEPLDRNQEPLREAYLLAIENGDFEYAALALVVRMMNLLDGGIDLQQWREELLECHATVKQLQQGNTLGYVDMLLQLGDNLMQS
jgi:predicted ATPase